MSCHYADDDAIDRLGRGLLDRTLPKLEWTHAAHFAATLWLMRTRPEVDLPREMPDIIRGYNVASGGENTDTAGYHETITQASLRAARNFLDAQPAGQPLHLTVDALMNSPLGKPGWLGEYWTKDVLMSVAARRAWVEPDIQRLPF